MKTMHVFESLLILAVLAVSPLASAHHSLAAFDGQQTVKVTGIVKEFQWMNPHVTVVVEGTAKDDVLNVRWTVEMQAPNAMMEQGWARDTLAIGDKVTIVANPLRREGAAAGCHPSALCGRYPPVRQVTRPNGRALTPVGSAARCQGRSGHLLDSPVEIPVLAPMIQREILFRLLLDKASRVLHGMVLAGSPRK